MNITVCRFIVVMLLIGVSAHHARASDSSIVFSRDTLFIETKVQIPVTRPASVIPANETPPYALSTPIDQDIPTNTNAVSRGTGDLPSPPTPDAPVMVNEIVTTIKRQPFFVTINNAESLEADWIVDLGEIRDDFGVMYVFDTPSPATIPPSDSEQAYDILFIGSYGDIKVIAQDIVASTLAEPIQIDTPVKALLYLAGGTVKKLGITREDRISHPTFPTPPNVESE